MLVYKGFRKARTEEVELGVYLYTPAHDLYKIEADAPASTFPKLLGKSFQARKGDLLGYWENIVSMEDGAFRPRVTII